MPKNGTLSPRMTLFALCTMEKIHAIYKHRHHTSNASCLCSVIMKILLSVFTQYLYERLFIPAAKLKKKNCTEYRQHNSK
jgi:hypothetical protein